MTNIQYMDRYNVEKKDLPAYIETYSYKSLMFTIALRDLWETIKDSFMRGLRKGKNDN